MALSIFTFFCNCDHPSPETFHLSQAEKVKVKVAQSCLTLYDLKDYTVHGILQSRILEWVAYPFSSRSSRLRRTYLSEGLVSCFLLLVVFSPHSSHLGSGKKITERLSHPVE